MSDSAQPKLRRILRKGKVLEFTGYKKSQLQELIDRNEFPKPVPLSDSGRGWIF
jgi:predicted DNA-binding transcriptional regulator AlpA